MILQGDELRRFQLTLLELIKEVDRICRKNGIEYSLDGGTLLGAVRHGGFIPWDDDADIVFYRPEYRKFFKACKKDLNTERFFLQEYRTDPEYPWGYAKLRLNGTEFIQPGQEHLNFHKGIYIDLFIYDQVPDNPITRRLHYGVCTAIRKCQYSAVGKLHADTELKRKWYGALDKVPKGLLFATLNYMALKTNGESLTRDKMSRRKRVSAPTKRTELVRHMTYPYQRKVAKYGLPRVAFDGYEDCEFEGEKLRRMVNYDPYMKVLYGDYMIIPPKEKQVGHLEVGRIKYEA